MTGETKPQANPRSSSAIASFVGQPLLHQSRLTTCSPRCAGGHTGPPLRKRETFKIAIASSSGLLKNPSSGGRCFYPPDKGGQGGWFLAEGGRAGRVKYYSLRLPPSFLAMNPPTPLVRGAFSTTPIRWERLLRKKSANARSSIADPQGGSKFQSAHLPAIAVIGFSSGWGTIPSSSGGIDPRANESVLIEERRGENETGDSASCGANVYSSVGALFFISGKRSSCFLGRVRLPRSRRASPLSSVGANSPSSCKFDS